MEGALTCPPCANHLLPSVHKPPFFHSTHMPNTCQNNEPKGHVPFWLKFCQHLPCLKDRAQPLSLMFQTPFMIPVSIAMTPIPIPSLRQIWTIPYSRHLCVCLQSALPRECPTPLLPSSCISIFVNFTCSPWTRPIPTASMKPSPIELILFFFVTAYLIFYLSI